MEKKRFAVAKLLAVLAFVGFVGCESPSSGSPSTAVDPSAVPAGYGRITVTIGQNGEVETTNNNRALSAFPTATAPFSYKADFTPTDGKNEPVLNVAADGNTITVDLKVGAYAITVKGTHNGTEVTLGTASVTVQTGTQTPPVTVTMEPKAESGAAKGTLSYTFTFPSTVTSSKIVIHPRKETGTTNDSTVNLTNGVPATKEFDPGVYDVTVSLARGDDKAGFNEVVYIYSGMTTPLSYTFNEGHFLAVTATITIEDGDLEIPIDNLQLPIVVQQGGTNLVLTVTTSEGFSNIKWFVDGEAAGTSASLTLPGSYSAKTHTLSVTAEKNSKAYSRSFEFTVTAGEVANGGGESGGGTVPEGYIPIGSVAEFKKIGKDEDYPLDGKYWQTADITISSSDNWTPIGISESSGNDLTKNFSGTFDGDNHNIKVNDNLTFSSAFSFFGNTNSATLKNIHISGVGSITTSGDNAHLGGIATVATDTTIDNCSNGVNLSVSSGGGSIGGICAAGGFQDTTSITNCSNTGNISALGSRDIGGIISNINSTKGIINCSNSGTVTGWIDSSTVYIGGIAGVGSSDVIACYNRGDVIVTGGKTINIGGIAGDLSAAGPTNASIIACYNTGKVEVSAAQVASGKFYIGGIVGTEGNGYATISASYSIGNVVYSGVDGSGSAIRIGGVCGFSTYSSSGSVLSTVVSSFWSPIASESGIGAKRTSTSVPVANAEASNEGTYKFSEKWPSTNTENGGHAAWGTGGGSVNGYWKSVGSSPSTYPVLWWE